MHAVVCLKQLPDTTEVKIDPATGTLVPAGVPSIPNPYDVHALEEALRLRERFGGKVTVISMGPRRRPHVRPRVMPMPPSRRLAPGPPGGGTDRVERGGDRGPGGFGIHRGGGHALRHGQGGCPSLRQHYRRVPRFLEQTPALFTAYPKAIDDALGEMLTVDGVPKATKLRRALRAVLSRRPAGRILADLYRGGRAVW